MRRVVEQAARREGRVGRRGSRTVQCSAHRQARFCRKLAGNHAEDGFSSLTTWSADVGQTHLVCSGPPQGERPRGLAR